MDFFRKFREIRTVEIRQVCGDELAAFLSQCTRLTELRLYCNSLRQPLLNQLAILCGSLKMLRIFDESDTELDLRPLYGLKQLFELEIHSTKILDTPFNLVLLFESCRYLAYVSLRMKFGYINIEKSDLYTVYTPWKFSPTECISKRSPENRRSFNYHDLKANLPTIIEQSKEAKKRLFSK